MNRTLNERRLKVLQLHFWWSLRTVSRRDFEYKSQDSKTLYGDVNDIEWIALGLALVFVLTLLAMYVM